MRRLEYLPVLGVRRCVVYIRQPQSLGNQPSSCSEIGFVFPGVIETSEPQGLWGFNLFSSNGRDGTPGLSAIKHLTKEELWLYRTPTHYTLGMLFLVLLWTCGPVMSSSLFQSDFPGLSRMSIEIKNETNCFSEFICPFPFSLLLLTFHTYVCFVKQELSWKFALSPLLLKTLRKHFPEIAEITSQHPVNHQQPI